ncbi:MULTISPECIES: GNAT family N-acetyltransferase [Pseudomonas]|jgi:ribosomal protein S18 acetylase RimI-like enzyme|uniref:GNAT family N-acetyltransferase n=1 Tax=Pseudomonas syringae Cit 7 TaxID=629264 RepID=A0A8T8M2I1_PSESX|nr:MULTISPECIES: GNAT family N-acetyltransferase [Pseudomonas]ALE01006.1 GNAT family acetyltransferase [Pseudomonas syringae UMAF0158]ELQ07816.1 acetyltransferase [Pseudomonas syringae BRIP39023]KPB29207.1 Acetyltransferase [Pseudomonas syringae pv. syringae]MBC8878705.1 GNAT family N-acetyltransferase [Pseudomonas cerasi]MBC9740723.1 GNAT family N-acetyltransferase [Pseudomonas syringae pv. syringae]
MTLTYRRLTPADAPAYRALMLEAYERHPDAFTSDVKEREVLPAQWWEKRLDDSADATEVVFAAVEDGLLLGVAGLCVETRKKARHKSTLFGMYVPLAHRNRGIGSRLVRSVLDHARTRPKLLVVQLTVTQGNAEAVGLYERMGFVTFGIEPLAVAVGTGFVAKVHMWKDLRG